MRREWVWFAFFRVGPRKGQRATFYGDTRRECVELVRTTYPGPHRDFRYVRVLVPDPFSYRGEGA